MLDCLTASPCVEAYRAEPMTTSEIDAHPDRARIWATIEAFRQSVTEAEEAAEKATYAGCAKDLQHIADNVDDDKVLEEIEKLIEEWS